MGFKPHLAQPYTERQFGLCKNQIHSLDDSTVNHIIPYSEGGKTVRENGQLAHQGCDAGRKLNCFPRQRLRRDVQPIERLAAFGTASFCPGEATAWTGILEHESRLM